MAVVVVSAGSRVEAQQQARVDGDAAQPVGRIVDEADTWIQAPCGDEQDGV